MLFDLKLLIQNQANQFMVTPVGPLAMIDCEPRQARKGATVVVISCAEVWLAGEATSFPLHRFFQILCLLKVLNLDVKKV